MAQLSSDIISQLVTLAGNSNLEVVVARDGCIVRNRSTGAATEPITAPVQAAVAQPAQVVAALAPVTPVAAPQYQVPQQAPQQYQQFQQYPQQFPQFPQAPQQFPQIPPFMWQYMMQAMAAQQPQYGMDAQMQAAYQQGLRQHAEAQQIYAAQTNLVQQEVVETEPEVEYEAPVQEAPRAKATKAKAPEQKPKQEPKQKAKAPEQKSEQKPKQETKTVIKGDWVKVAIAASNKPVPARSPAAAVVGVDIESQAIPEGYVTGDHLSRTAKNGSRPIRPVCHTVNCDGNCTDFRGVDIPRASKTLNVAVHGNAYGSRPTTANFCNNGGVSGERICDNPKCTNNHVLNFMTPEQLNEVRRAGREQSQKNRERGRGRRSNAINGNGEHPGQTQIADFVRVDGVDTNEEEADSGTPRVLSVSIGGLNVSTDADKTAK